MQNFTNDFSKEIWFNTHRDNGENSIDDTWRRVAKAIASVEKDSKYWEEEFYGMLSGFHVCPGGRILANAGGNWKGTTLINCFVGARPKYDLDSLDGIMEVLRIQAQTLKSEGGYGMNFSFIRPRGSFIYGIGVESPGAVKYMELFNKSSDVITCGTVTKDKGKKKIRKGAMLACLGCWHPDIEEFITAKLTPNKLDKFNISVGCYADFMSAVRNNEDWNLIFPDTTFNKYKAEWDGNIHLWQSKGYPVKVYKTLPAKHLWDLIIKSTYTRNEPGVLFLDIANKTHLFNYGGSDYVIQASNPCQPGWAKVITMDGIRNINDIKIGDKIWSQEGWTKIINKANNKKNEIFKYETTGNIFYGTKNHKILEQGQKIEVNEAYSIDILVGPYVKNIDFDLSIIMDGLVLGDGSIHKASNNLIYLNIGQNDGDYFNSEISFLIKKRRSGISKYAYEIDTNINYLELPKTYERIIPKRYVFGNRKTICSFLRGLYSANGSVCGGRVALKSSSKKIIESVQIMLSSIGINSYVTYNKETKVKFKNGEYLCKKSYDLNITYDKNKFCESIGFIQKYKTDKLELSLINKSCKPPKKTYDIINKELISIEETYDLTVDNQSHTYWSQGCNVSNCGEQCLIFAGTCDLGSLVLPYFVDFSTGSFDFEKLRKKTKLLVRFLDNVNDHSYAPLPEYKESMVKLRRIGIGIMGWGSALYLLKTKYGSEKAEDIKKDLMRVITHAAVEESISLAKEKGMFDGCDPIKQAEHIFWQNIELPPHLVEEIKQHGIRNSALFSIQPTGNTGCLCNNVSGGLEPIFAHDTIRTVICQEIPDNIKSFCPDFYKGEFKETSLFKFHKEGDETILRGVSENGTIYKIDKNRGLTKEILCDDFSINLLKSRGEWDKNADWAVTSQDLSVEEHLTDLCGWGKWLDSSSSKTVNIPHDYPFEDFEQIYLKGYDSGLLKGLTTYRTGTMTSVLSVAETTITRPQKVPAQVYQISVKKEKYFIVVGLINDRPYEIFASKNEDLHVGQNVKSGYIYKDKKGVYSFRGEDDKTILDNLEEYCSDNEESIVRLVSISLQGGTQIGEIIRQLEKAKGDLYSYSKALARVLKKFTKDGESIKGEKCTECDGILVRESGCIICKNCGFSKC